MAEVRLEHVTKIFKSRAEHVYAVKELSLAIADREFVVLVGPSGCGKSTALRLVAGLEEASEGAIWIDGRAVPMMLEASLFGVKTGGATARVPLATLDDITSGLDDNAMAAIENAGPGILTNATGRISLRIDLPKDGEVYHFAATGDRAAITVDASESSSSWWQALLAVLFLSLGALVLRLGGR